MIFDKDSSVQKFLGCTIYNVDDVDRFYYLIFIHAGAIIYFVD
jgi:hypothetical protein